MSFLGHGAYKLDDGTGTIWVISSHGVPRRGARVNVHGRIRDVVDVSTIMRLPEQIGSGLVMTDAYLMNTEPSQKCFGGVDLSQRRVSDRGAGGHP